MPMRLRAFRIDDDLWEKVIEKSEDEETTVSEIIRDALARYAKKPKPKKRK